MKGVPLFRIVGLSSWFRVSNILVISLIEFLEIEDALFSFSRNLLCKLCFVSSVDKIFEEAF